MMSDMTWGSGICYICESSKVSDMIKYRFDGVRTLSSNLTPVGLVTSH